MWKQFCKRNCLNAIAGNKWCDKTMVWNKPEEISCTCEKLVGKEICGNKNLKKVSFMEKLNVPLN